jgi:NADP-dependent aldehyde dehydrogenase
MTQSYSPRDGSMVSEVDDTPPIEVLAKVDRAVAAAYAAAAATPDDRSRWLHAVAEALEEHCEDLVQTADRETALGSERLTAELARAADQLRFYGRVAEDGAYLDVAVDAATSTSPRLVRINRPLGPVAVFGSSNFPFAFGVLGNDTGSALAAGCPVVAKAHPAHVQTSLRLVEVAANALASAGAPTDILSVVVGYHAGADLITADGIAAVGFTGSQRGGLALWRLANERSRVIPVYAEMGTVNPVVLTTRGAARVKEVARGFASSFTLGAGQFCTKPGLLFAPAGSGFSEAVAAALRAAAPAPVMLTEAIARGVATGVEEFADAGATVVERVCGTGGGWSADAVVLSAPISAIAEGSRLLEECFGPVAVVVEYEDAPSLAMALDVLHGSLAAAVFGGEGADPEVAPLVERLSARVGRVTVGDWPTGVAWTWAQQHGGPWPATSNPASTSVGAAALDRFVRPVTFQSVADGSLPAFVRAAIAPSNPWGIPRRVNGRLVIP